MLIFSGTLSRATLSLKGVAEDVHHDRQSYHAHYEEQSRAEAQERLLDDWTARFSTSISARAARQTNSSRA